MLKPNQIDCYNYIRKYYHVPAYIGMLVTIHGKHGVLVPARSDQHYLHVMFDGSSIPCTAHPTDDVQYHVEGREAVVSK